MHMNDTLSDRCVYSKRINADMFACGCVIRRAVMLCVFVLPQKRSFARNEWLKCRPARAFFLILHGLLQRDVISVLLN